MLPRKHRLKKQKDFERVMKQGQAFNSSFLFLKMFPNQLEFSRAGFVVSKKVSNRAVKRNKVKRRLREAVRANLSKIRPGYDLVFLTRPLVLEKDFWQVKEEIEWLLKKAGLFGDNAEKIIAQNN